MQNLLTLVKAFPKLIDKAEQKIRNSYLLQAPLTKSSPIIIFGNQKTGTSAIAGLLAEATSSSVTIDFFIALKHHFSEKNFLKKLYYFKILYKTISLFL